MYTKCPECQTLFRVRAEILRQAHGQVRCGLCGEQFDALPRLSEDPESLLAAPAETPNVTPSAAAASDAILGDALVAAQDEPKGAESIEAVAEESLDADLASAAEIGDETEFTPEFEAEAGDGKAIESLPLPEDDDAGVEEILLTGMSNDAEIDREGEPADSGPVAEAETRTDSGAEAISEIKGQEEALEGAVTTEPQTLANELAREALLLEDGEPPARTGQVLAGLATLILLVLLAGQWVYMQRVPLYEKEALRPLLQRFCVTLGCELPLPRAPGRFEIVDRLVREHPKVPGALLVDLTFVSRSAQVVAYPVLELRLADVSGGRVAGRRFQPTEYLSAGIDPSLGVLPNRLTHVNLELMTPEVEVVSFQFEFL